MKIEIYSPLFIHELGQRNNQEDSLYPLSGKATADDRLFLVCDGMGGHEHGEVASRTVCEAIGEWFESNVGSNAELRDDMLLQAIEHAYKCLNKQDSNNVKKMGTTLTLLYIHSKGVTAAHIGDSRIYHVRPGYGLLYQSRDHSLVYELYQAGEISYDEIHTSPQKNIITRAMQPCNDEEQARPDIIHINDIKPGDWFYMCSDGMLEEMSNEELYDIFSADTTNDTKRDKLIAATKGNSDNHTAWLIRVKSVETSTDDAGLPNEELTSRYNALNIKPKTVEEHANDDDVSIVVPAIPVNRPYKSVSKYMLMLASCVFVMAVVAFFLSFRNSSKTKNENGIQQEQINNVIDDNIAPVIPVKKQKKDPPNTGTNNTKPESKKKDEKENNNEKINEEKQKDAPVVENEEIKEPSKEDIKNENRRIIREFDKKIKKQNPVENPEHKVQNEDNVMAV